MPRVSHALILLLVTMNAGVAIWWASREAPPAARPPPLAGVPSLRLLHEPATAAQANTPAVTTAARVPSSAQIATGPLRCIRFGAPLQAGNPAVLAALTVPGSKPIRSVEAMTPPRAWRVLLRPLATLNAARAQAERIRAAGFEDLLVVADGPEAGSIALGRYDGREAAERHRTALATAGIAAEVLPAAAPTVWLTLQVPATTDLAEARARLGALQALEVDCSTAR